MTSDISDLPGQKGKGPSGQKGKRAKGHLPPWAKGHLTLEGLGLLPRNDTVRIVLEPADLATASHPVSRLMQLSCRWEQRDYPGRRAAIAELAGTHIACMQSWRYNGRVPPVVVLARLARVCRARAVEYAALAEEITQIMRDKQAATDQRRHQRLATLARRGRWAGRGRFAPAPPAVE